MYFQSMLVKSIFIFLFNTASVSFASMPNIVTLLFTIFRLDERLLILVCGVVSMIISTACFLPIPGNENKHICNETDTKSPLYRLLSPPGTLGDRVPCSESQDLGCCALDWCEDQAAMNVPQFVIGFCILAAGHPFRISITQSLFTKILGPVPQVKIHST